VELSFKELLNYIDKVYEYGEYVGLDKYVQHYNPEQVAASYYPVIRNGYETNLSYRMVVLILFACTIEKIQRDEVKH